jgi:hypothetical protein
MDPSQNTFASMQNDAAKTSPENARDSRLPMAGLPGFVSNPEVFSRFHCGCLDTREGCLMGLMD